MTNKSTKFMDGFYGHFQLNCILCGDKLYSETPISNQNGSFNCNPTETADT